MKIARAIYQALLGLVAQLRAGAQPLTRLAAQALIDANRDFASTENMPNR
jgi:hypothetical protein